MSSVDFVANGTANLPGHLDYYLRHRINPVRYEMQDLRRHFERRASLYRALGLIPKLIRDARVLEVAPGSGQNSLYVANVGPRELVLVEPNPVAQHDIKSLYAESDIAPIRPTLVESTFQDFRDQAPFDVVVCENWLGHSAAERALLIKLGSLVADDGLLVITTVSAVGILPNVLRKALTCRIDRSDAPFDERTRILETAFAPHLATIPAMTRGATDWVHDNVMNPAYFGILLTIPMVVDDLGGQFDVFGSSPRFAADWRWFKSMYGERKEFNGHFLGEYYSNLHNFFDYRWAPTTRVPRLNRVLEQLALDLSQDVCALEFHVDRQSAPARAAAQAIVSGVDRIMHNMRDLHRDCRRALTEFRQLFQQPQLTAEQIGSMQWFGSLFGRETLYLSLEKTR